MCVCLFVCLVGWLFICVAVCVMYGSAAGRVDPPCIAKTVWGGRPPLDEISCCSSILGGSTPLKLKISLQSFGFCGEKLIRPKSPVVLHKGGRPPLARNSQCSWIWGGVNLCIEKTAIASRTCVCVWLSVCACVLGYMVVCWFVHWLVSQRSTVCLLVCMLVLV